jgi:hypothetical protein
VPDNDVVKPTGLAFKDMADYKANGKNADAKYIKLHPVKIKQNSSIGGSSGLKGKNIRHKTYGDGTITKYDGTIITVSFLGTGNKALNYQFCIDNGLIEFI